MPTIICKFIQGLVFTACFSCSAFSAEGCDNGEAVIFSCQTGAQTISLCSTSTSEGQQLYLRRNEGSFHKADRVTPGSEQLIFGQDAESGGHRSYSEFRFEAGAHKLMLTSEEGDGASKKAEAALTDLSEKATSSPQECRSSSIDDNFRALRGKMPSTDL